MEQSYKEKYERALAKAKEQYNYPCMRSCMGILEEIFPELAESKDEKTRKEIIRFIRMEVEDEIVGNKWLAWLENVPVTIDHEKREGFHLGYKACLEKQGEKKFEMKSAEESLGIDSDTYNKIVDECIFGEQKPANKIEPKDYSSIDPHFDKPTDKVEPKFHEGEWITNGDYTWKIVEVKPLDYILQSQDGNVVDDTISHVDEQFHSFTIQDAKDGDVLVTRKKQPFIFKNYDENTDYVYAYCGICDLVKDNSFYADNDQLWTCYSVAGDVYPTTKEQRNALMKAMADAGYEWSDKDRKLIKIVKCK